MTSFAVVVAFVADWSLPAVGQALEVAPIEDEVIDLWLPCCRIIWADQVFSFPLVAVPIFSAVVWVWEIAIPKLTAVRNMSTVNGCGRGWWRRLGGTHWIISRARSSTTVNIFSVGTPIKLGVINPWESISKGFALLVGNCSLDTVIVEGAGL